MKSNPASSGEQTPVAAGVIQNIMFVKDSTEDRFDPLIVRYFPDGEPDSRDFEEMNYMDFAENFNEFVNLYYGTKVASHDLQHRYMAENLLNTMGKALMDIHKNQFNADYQSLNREMKKNGDYPNGVTVEFYKNLFWGGFNKTFAYAQMEAIKAYPPILSPFQKYRRDLGFSELLTKPCGN